MTEEDNTREKLMMAKLEERARNKNESVDFTVLDMPVELKNKYISMAKLHYDNHVWQVMADAMDSLLEERTTRTDDLEQRVNELEAEIDILKGMLKYSDEQKNSAQKKKGATFGEMKEIDTTDDLDKLKEISQRGESQHD